MPKRRRINGGMTPECVAGHHDCCTENEMACTEQFDCSCACHDEVFELDAVARAVRRILYR